MGETRVESFYDLAASGAEAAEGDLSASGAAECLHSEAAQPSFRHPFAPEAAAPFSLRSLGRVLVLGLGKSGKSVVQYCLGLLGARVDSVFVAAGKWTADSEAFLSSIACEGLEWAFGDDALEGVEGGFDLCVASPGIPFWHELYIAGQRLSGELISEVELAWRESAPDSTWVAITGTNGKTTTTSLAAHVLRECGFKAAAVGNIGDVCLDAVAAGETDVYVAEVSSYQLASTRYFRPDVAVLLNITPDHIHWHQTFEAYCDAKFSLVDRALQPGRSGETDTPSTISSNADSGEPSPTAAPGDVSRAELTPTVIPSGARSAEPRDIREASDPDLPSQAPGLPVAILDATNDVVRAKVRELKAAGANYIPLGTADGIRGDMRARCGAPNAAFLADDMLTVAYGGEEHVLLPASSLQIEGDHNASNALAAAAVAVALGADDASIAEGLASFAPLEHRVEPCGSIAGVACYNDSKATNVDATCKALEAFPDKRVVVLLGGDDKGTDLADLVASVHAHASAAVCFGEAGPRFSEAFELAAAAAPDGFARVDAAHLEDALDAALGLAEAGDVVLLSPACASFDEFSSFEQRGCVFKELVAARSKREGGR